MCGIFGIFSGYGEQPSLASCVRSLTRLRHRGPDDEGYLLVNTRTGYSLSCCGHETFKDLKLPYVEDYHSCDFDLLMGHRRLSIIDLSPAGHQPLSNEEETVWITYNGEIYNYAELRGVLTSRGHTFRSNTDTEIIVHAYEEWGTGCVHQFNGMWAFAIWDQRRESLFCARDRFGIKPFYYCFQGGTFVFASEIKAILEAGLTEREPNYGIIYDYLAGGLVDHHEETFFAGVKRLAAGHALHFQRNTKGPEIYPYYDLPFNKINGLSDREYASRFSALLKDSVRLRLAADVPVGSCLSGGLDSSSIVCLTRELIKEMEEDCHWKGLPQRVFSARYPGSRHDEGIYLTEVLKKTGAEASFTYPAGENLPAGLQQLVTQQEEPFGSTSIYAQWEVFKVAAASGIKVVLDGQGGDEILAGYHRYFHSFFADLIKSLRWMEFLSEITAYINQPHTPSAGLTLLGSAFRFIPRGPAAMLKRLLPGHSLWINRAFAENFKGRILSGPGVESTKKRSLLDHELFKSLRFSDLPSCLRYEDKNSMAHSIEARLPFLDYRLVEFTLATPRNQKISQGITKRILRNAMKGVVPEVILQRRDKIGFSTPEDIWFRTSLKEFITGVIESVSFRQRPFFDIQKVRCHYSAHLQGRKNFSAVIWRWVNLEIWMREFMD
jgi:asparagine synthase (glutamine-hydrolysing)